jgi:hypothetical protein
MASTRWQPFPHGDGHRIRLCESAEELIVATAPAKSYRAKRVTEMRLRTSTEYVSAASARATTGPVAAA